MSDFIQDFSRPKVERETIKFKVDDDLFEAYPEIGGNVLMPAISLDGLDGLVGRDQASLQALSPEEQARAATAVNSQTVRALQFMDVVLLPDSAVRFAERMRSVEEPITLEQAFQIWRWLLSQYGARPTEPSSPSENGHDGTGPSSTAGAPVGA